MKQACGTRLFYFYGIFRHGKNSCKSSHYGLAWTGCRQTRPRRGFNYRRGRFPGHLIKIIAAEKKVKKLELISVCWISVKNTYSSTAPAANVGNLKSTHNTPSYSTRELFGSNAEIGRLASGECVVDRAQSHLAHGDRNVVSDALCRVSSGGRQFIEQEVQFSSAVGVTACVATGEFDDIIYAQRTSRHGFTRFVKNRAPEGCSSVFVVLKKADPQKYVLITGFVGQKPEPEPFDRSAFERRPNPAAAKERSIQFWAGHALIWSPECIIQGTERKTSPVIL